MPVVTLNYGSIVVCAVINMVLGFLWYGPIFGKAWAKMMGFDMSDKHKMQEMQKKAMPGYGAMFITSLLAAYVLSHFLEYALALTVQDGMVTAFWAWLGFVTGPTLAANIFGGKKFALWFIDAGYYLVSLLIFGAVLVSWV